MNTSHIMSGCCWLPLMKPITVHSGDSVRCRDHDRSQQRRRVPASQTINSPDGFIRYASSGAVDQTHQTAGVRLEAAALIDQQRRRCPQAVGMGSAFVTSPKASLARLGKRDCFPARERELGALLSRLPTIGLWEPEHLRDAVRPRVYLGPVTVVAEGAEEVEENSRRERALVSLTASANTLHSRGWTASWILPMSLGSSPMNRPIARWVSPNDPTLISQTLPGGERVGVSAVRTASRLESSADRTRSFRGSPLGPLLVDELVKLRLQ
jgi:hypothetical protein